MNKQILEEVKDLKKCIQSFQTAKTRPDHDCMNNWIDRLDKILSDERLSKAVDVDKLVEECITILDEGTGIDSCEEDVLSIGYKGEWSLEEVMPKMVNHILSTVAPVEGKEPSIEDLIKSQEIIKHFNKMDTDSFITKYEIFKGDVCPDEWKKEFKFTGLNNVDFMRVWPTPHNPSKESTHE